MSSRFKRHISKASTSTGDAGGGGGSACGAMARKKRKLENASSDDEERSFWTPKHLGDLKAYNRSASEAPAELFRKDLISAMKLADNEPLTADDYWGISDQWKQEWERGVQVPVNPDSLPEPSVKLQKDYPKPNCDFRLPRRFIRVTHNDFFNNERHVLSNLPTKAEKMCRYDMDNLDDVWLKAYNGERARMGAEPVPHHIFELIIEHLEEMCWENIHKLLKEEETLSIEYDEDVICDVCRSPDREEGNEMVFCDVCNICVHQACYGITAIPSGSWLCRTCSLGIKPNCDLCPNKGGAMKSTKSGHKWAHVACALWIPEVSIGSVERMEPITKIANIPQSRWALVCVLCRERRGACIQCSVKSCKTAYHVTCAFKHGLEMKAIVEDENADDVKLRSYCEKHSMTNKKDTSDIDSDAGGQHKKKKDLTNEQKNQARAAKLRQIEAEFYQHVNILETSTVLDIDLETTETIFYYWKLKRRSGFNKPLLTPRCQELDLLSHQQEQDIERMKMFVQLRQYLERVRNLCYMVSRREKLSKSYLKTREQTFSKQASLLSNSAAKLTSQETDAIAQANHSHSVYDQLYSHKGAEMHTQNQFEQIAKLIRGPYAIEDKGISDLANAKRNLYKDINGLIKNHRRGMGYHKGNPYRKTYFNGAEQRRSRSRSISTETSSTEDSDSSLASTKWKLPEPGSHLSVFTSSEDEKSFTAPYDDKYKMHFESSPHMKFKSYCSSEDDVKESAPHQAPPTPKAGRGRGAIKRGRGRPRRGSKVPNLCNSEEDKILKENQIFDALMKSPAGVSPFKREPLSCTFLDFSSDEDDKRRRPTKGRPSKVTPIKQETLSSSDEELPLLPVKSPSKRGKGRGRGRGSRRMPSVIPIASGWSYPIKNSDDDDLGPATYRLTSEEDEKSDKSREDLFGPGSDKSAESDGGEGSPRNRSHFRHSKRNVQNTFDSDEMETITYNQLKTKAAMKEFMPKLPANEDKDRHKRESRHGSERARMSKKDAANRRGTDLSLFVPQRAAAKKASELITSQNVAVGNSQGTLPLEPNSSDIKRQLLRSRDVEFEESPIIDDSAKKALHPKPRRGRSGKDRQDIDSEIEPPKKNIFEPPEILPYVPIREAARKAAENLKGAGKGGAVPLLSGQDDIPELPQNQKPRKAKGEGKSHGQRLTRNRSPRNAAKNANDSDEDHEILTKSSQKKVMEERLEKGRSVFAEGEEELASPPRKDRVGKASEKVLESPKDTANKQQLFRGDIYVRDHQSSSENEDDKELKLLSQNRGREATVKVSVEKEDVDWSRSKVIKENKNHSFRSTRNLSEFYQTEEHETENEEPPAETHRKAPDKKLKTSDGRPEHGFQPPVTQRDESRISPNKQANKILSPESTNSEESPLKIRESGVKCRSGIVAGNVPKKDLRSDIDASLSAQKVKPTETSGRARKLDKRNAFKEEVSSFESFQDSEDSWRRNGQIGGKIQSEEPAKPNVSETFPEKGFKSTFECISSPFQEEAPLITPLANEHVKGAGSNLGIFNFTEKEVEVNRLDDIEETSDTDQEPKKVRITDSDDDNDDSKVEQPKDSGYKSAIATPEPLDKIGSDGSHSNSLTDDKRKMLLREVSQMQPKSGIPKFGPLSRRKNLEDVIEERKKAAEHTEAVGNDLAQTSVSSFQMSEPAPVSAQSSLTGTTAPSGSISATASSQSSLTGTIAPSGSISATASNFVEQWREQWMKNAHLDPSTSYPPLTHRSGLSSLNDFQYPYIDMQANHYPNNLSVYFNQYKMMQLAFLQQQYGMPPKMHDNQIDKDANLQPDQAPLMPPPWEHFSRLPSYEEPKLDSLVSKGFSLLEPETANISPSQPETGSMSRSKPNTKVDSKLSVPTPDKYISNSSINSTPTFKPISVADSSSSSELGQSIKTLPKEMSVFSESSVPVSKTASKRRASPSSRRFHSASKTSPQEPAALSVSGKVDIPSSAITDISKDVSLHSSNLELHTPNTSVLPKRVPIYMQDHSAKVPEKRSPRGHTGSPRFAKQEKKEKRQTNKKASARGRATVRGKRKGKYNSISVPKELVGTVYEFDDDFDDDGPANNTLDDLRQLREKRQSVDIPSAAPITQNSNTPTYTTDATKDQPPKKRVKEKKIKSGYKTPKHEQVDEVAKILEDYRNQQNSTLKRSVHEPSPPHMGSPFEPKKHNSPANEMVNCLEEFKLSKSNSFLAEERKKQDSLKTGSNAASSFASSLPEDRTNQLKLKIKGPYANSYLSSSFTAPTQEASSNPVPQSTTTTLRRMRKKELIRQYCYQDMNPDNGENSSVSNCSNLPLHLRTGITLPKAVASMTSIPTREDYKMYMQDDSSLRGNSGRRKRAPRELKQLDWTMLDEKGRRNNDGVQEGGRKRPRIKETMKQSQLDTKDSIGGSKLRISFGKKLPEVNEVMNDTSNERRELSSRGKPPKKRHPEESTIMKVKSDNLKFREEIMANFDRSGGKNGPGEKKNKKRKVGHSSEDGSSPLNSEVKDEGMDYRKLVLKITKCRPEAIDEKVAGGAANNNNPLSHPLKIRLNLASLAKAEEGSGERSPESELSLKEKMIPLKIKLQRRPEGYVRSKSPDASSNIEGSGPPDDSCEAPPHSKSLEETPIEHKDGESLMKTDDSTNSAGELLPVAVTEEPPESHSRISEDVLQRLEAHLAAADGGVPSPPLPAPNPSDIQNDNLFGSPEPFHSIAPPAAAVDGGCR